MVIASHPSAVLAVAACGGICAAVDLASRRVPNALTLPIASAGFLFAAMRMTDIGPAAAVAGSVIALALMLPAHVFGATGAGDVKLFAALGAWLGPGRVGPAFLYTALAGGAIALAIACRRRRTAGTFAYAPAIAAGTLAAALGW